MPPVAFSHVELQGLGMNEPMKVLTFRLQEDLSARLQLFSRDGVRTADSDVSGVHSVDLTTCPDDVDLLLFDIYCPSAKHFAAADLFKSGCELHADGNFIVNIELQNFDAGAELSILVWRNRGENWRVRMAYKGGGNYDERGYTADR
jgi:hypothetical protein